MFKIILMSLLQDFFNLSDFIHIIINLVAYFEENVKHKCFRQVLILMEKAKFGQPCTYIPVTLYYLTYSLSERLAPIKFYGVVLESWLFNFQHIRLVNLAFFWKCQNLQVPNLENKADDPSLQIMFEPERSKWLVHHSLEHYHDRLD